MSVLGVIAAGAAGIVTGGNPQAMMLAYSVVSGVESIINPPKIEGPRLDELEMQMSNYGSPIPIEWGTNRHAGTVMWPKVIELKEHSHEESAKGGPEVTSYTYTVTMAVLICEGPIKGVTRIWANKKLVYDVLNKVGTQLNPDLRPVPSEPVAVLIEDEGGSHTEYMQPQQDPAIGTVRFYLGTEDQEPDPLIVAIDGPSPAYKGYAYAVFEDYDLSDSVNRPPQFEFEVVTEGDAAQQPPKLLGPGGASILYTNPSTEEQSIWSVSGANLYVYSLPDEELIQTIALPSFATSITQRGGRIWVGYSESAAFANSRAASAINPVTYAIEENTMFGYMGAVSRIGTVVSDGSMLYAFVNEGLGAGAVKYLSSNQSNIALSNITVPHYVYQALEMPDLHMAALTGEGDWLVIADLLSDSTVTTIWNTDWNGGTGHRVVRDMERNCLYWSAVSKWNVYRISLEDYTIEKLIDVPVVEGMHYNAADDTIYVDVPGGGLNAYSPESGALSSTLPGAGALAGGKYGRSIDVGSTEYYYAAETGNENKLWRINLKGALAPDKIPLSKIVGDICQRAGMDAADIDVSQLTDLVDGYIVPRQMSARAAIEPLQTAFYFDAVESDGKLKFVKRAASSPITIPMEDRAARDFGSDLPDSLSIVRAQDMELPVQVDVEYADINADHLIGNQYARRITKDTKQRINIQSPVVMDAVKAKEVAKVTLYRAWLNQTYRFATTRQYAHLEPTDLVALPTRDAVYTARLTAKREQPGGVIEWEASMEGVDVYTQSGADATPTNYVPQGIYKPSKTVLELMDIPLVRDVDAGKGFPVAMAGTSASWPGAQLFKSSDNGSTYGALFSQSGAAVIGAATTKLGDFTGGDIFDEGNSVTVKIQPGGQLISYSEAQLLDGTSAFALGVNGRWEIIQYRTATLTAPLTYTLTGLLRGRKGTEWATGTHQAGDHFVLLNGGGVQFYDPGVADANVERLYKAPAFRAALSAAAAVPFTDTLVRLRPYSVANLKVEDTGNSHMITWAHRSILGGGWRDGGDVPLDATFVAFDVSILKMDGTLVKTYSVTDEFFDYTDAQAAADFGAAPGEFKVRVAQRNSDYGQGIGVTVATTDAGLGYDVPPIYTGGGGVTPGDPEPEPDAPATDAWKFEGRIDELLLPQYKSYYGNLTHATASHVFLFGGVTHVYVPGGNSYFEANPNVYIFDRATKTFDDYDNGQISGMGFEGNGGVVGDKHYSVDGRAPVRTTVLGVRKVVRNDFTDPAAPTRSVYDTTNAMLGEFPSTRATINNGLMVNGKVYFPLSRSVYDPAANAWEALMPAVPVDCRYRALLGRLGNKLYFIGGTTSYTDPYEDINPGPVQNAPRDETTYKKEVWAFDTVAGTWARKADLPYALAVQMVRYSTSNDPNFYATFNVEGVNGKLYVFDSNGQILVYDEAANAWITKPNRISYRMFVSTSVVNDGIWMSTHIGIKKAYGSEKANQDLDSYTGGDLNDLELAQRLLFRYTPSLDV